MVSACPEVGCLVTGAFGFVQLARNKNNGQLVAIKFIERGPDKATPPPPGPPDSHTPMQEEDPSIRSEGHLLSVNAQGHSWYTLSVAVPWKERRAGESVITSVNP